MSFCASKPLTVGIELELQLVDPLSGQLLDRAADIVPHVPELTAEITQAMLEYNSPVCETVPQLYEALRPARDNILSTATRFGMGVCGGGLHPFHCWSDRQVSGGERFDYLRQRYAYLAQMFTVFGQHIHIGCRNGQDALYLTHALSQYVPHFIAIAASSPFYRGVDTEFHCARLNILSACPTSGTAPWSQFWKDFEKHFSRLKELGVAQSVKDLYWDIRPKAETGTVEIRVCDTPLTIEEAVDLVAYAQLLCFHLLSTRYGLREDIYLPYRANRFQACRYGLEGTSTDPLTGSAASIRDEILKTIERLWPMAQELGCADLISRLAGRVENGINGATRLRQLIEDGACYTQLVSAQMAMWAGKKAELHKFPKLMRAVT